MGHSPPSVVSTGELAKAQNCSHCCKVRLRVHDKVLSTSPRSGETQRLTTCDLIHSLTTKSGRQVAFISIRQNKCHTKVKGGNIVLIKHFRKFYTFSYM